MTKSEAEAGVTALGFVVRMSPGMSEKEAFEIRVDQKLAAERAGAMGTDSLEPLTLAGFLRQGGHRTASIGLLALVGALGMVVANNLSRLGIIGPAIDIKVSTYGGLLLAAFLTCDVALTCTAAGWWVDPQRDRSDRETMGLVFFSLVLMVVSLTMYVLAKGGGLDRMAAAM